MLNAKLSNFFRKCLKKRVVMCEVGVIYVATTSHVQTGLWSTLGDDDPIGHTWRHLLGRKHTCAIAHPVLKSPVAV